MKKVSLMLFFICSVLFANAQTKSFNYYAQETLDAIGATAEQQTQIKELKKKTDSEIRAVKNDASVADADKKAKYKVIYAEGSATYRKILSEEQNAKLKALFIKFKEENN
jgi:hypothetical protein